MKLNEHIDEFIDFENVSVSKDTDDKMKIIQSFFTVINETVEYEQYMVSPFKVIPGNALFNSDHKYWKSDSVKQLFEELLHVINLYTPEGYFFGEHPDEKFNYGFWEKKRFCPILAKKEIETYYKKDEVVCDGCSNCDQKEYSRIERMVNIGRACNYEGKEKNEKR